MKTRIAVLASILFGVASVTALGGPKIGDKAPAVKVAEWIASKPPMLPGEKGAEKHVFVVEFWATWCGPCLRSIPHLAELHTKHEKDGLVILGISNEEAEDVKKFIEKKKMNMPYFVGLDDEMGTNEAYMKDVRGIPHCYVVDKSNTIIWQGNPLDTAALDHVVKEVLAGRFNVESAKAEAAAAEKYNETMTMLQAAYAERNEEKMFKLVDELIALKPREVRAYQIKRQLLTEFGKQDQLAAWDEKIFTVLAEDLEAMSSIAEMQLHAELHERNPALMLRAARRADELCKGRDADVLATLAQVQCQLGMVNEAIETQKRAVGLAGDEEIDSYRKVLAYYQSVKKLGADGAGDEKSAKGKEGE